jgi:spermidine/putrescine ABC transporter ATP-binding subunit
MTQTAAPAAPGSDSATGGAITIRGLKKSFGEHQAIKKLDLEIQPGEFISLLGPSGCGKTTLLRMIAGFEEPTEGEILLDGKDLLDLPAHKRPVNTVFQSYALFPHMSVAENVGYGLKRAKVPRKEIGPRVKEALEMVRMEGFADRKPDMLSGGQQQRVALARALVNRPRVLLLDEPMSALDRKLREEMQLELIRLHTDLGLTFIFVTHDQEEALAMSDRIVVMYDGVVQQLGEAEDIYGNPANSFVAGFIGKQNFNTVTLDSIEGASATLSNDRLKLLVPAGAVNGFSVGQTVQAAIRPEAISIAPASAVASSGVAANQELVEVIGESFLGDIVQYLVRVGEEHTAIVRISSTKAPDVHEGDTALIEWPGDSVQIFANTPEA